MPILDDRDRFGLNSRLLQQPCEIEGMSLGVHSVIRRKIQLNPWVILDDLAEKLVQTMHVL